ncbi:MAG: hypothetical protein KDC48_20440 [Planctomycetes bacterium]|nr:hypothetical protein [Planctomycetota bacterium]
MARLVRCPVCLRPGRDPGPSGQLRCKGCERTYTGATALPFDAGSSVVARSGTEHLWDAGLPLFIALVMFLLVVRMDWVHVPTRGPHFLVGFALLAVVMRIALAMLRRSGSDTLYATLAMLAAFEGVGVTRWIEGHAAGMRDFTVLEVMMVLGIPLFFLRFGAAAGGARKGDGTTGSSSCSSSCSSDSSSCSGCGGGGGCGGCGG